MSHLSSADEDGGASERQRDLFRQVAGQFPARRYSLANSAGIALGDGYHFDVTRPGLALYGGVARDEFAGRIEQVAHIAAMALNTRDIAAGESVGYNARFTAQRPMRVATVSLGYADGFLRARGRGGMLLHNGVKLPVLGTVSMDMIVVDITAAPDVAMGDWLDVPFDLPAIAVDSGLSQYELLTTIGPRLRR